MGPGIGSDRADRGDSAGPAVEIGQIDPGACSRTLAHPRASWRSSRILAPARASLASIPQQGLDDPNAALGLWDGQVEVGQPVAAGLYVGGPIS